MMIRSPLGASDDREYTEHPGDATVDREHAERVALGRSLQDRSDDILRICQQKLVDDSDGVTIEAIATHPMWELITVAVTAIAAWLQTGSVAGGDTHARIASLGNVVALDQQSAIEGRAADRPGPSPSADGDGRYPSGVLSVAMFAKLNLWWEDTTSRVLTEEAARLGISDRTLDAATAMVAASCKSSMVRMAKQYDAELQDLRAQMVHLANHDQLTGLANRAVFLERLEVAIARLDGERGGVAVVFIDLDGFKAVNDAFGHHFGDELLSVVADRLTTRMRPEHTVARFGGDEFVVLFEDLTEPSVEAQALATRLHRAVAEPIEIAGESVSMTASIGVAVVTGAACTSEDVVAQADMTMYGVKRTGRNRVAMIELSKDRCPAVFALASELRGALERRELTLAYQPVFSSRSGALVGFEALLRWTHPIRGAIPPLDVIPAAEESGFMPALGAWVLEEACAQAVAWSRSLGDGLSMAVNISGRQLADPRLPEVVARVLSQSGMRPEALILEIAEGVMQRESCNHESVLGALKALGVRLSIDDFGSGYSSLSYLRGLPADQVKMDRGFVADVAEHGDMRIMGVVVDLAHDLGLEIVAEGVELEEQRAVVESMGFDSMQGFLLGHPSPPGVVEQRFAREGSRVPARRRAPDGEPTVTVRTATGER